jgi:hypothetical protein
MGSGIQVEALPSRTAVAPAIGRVAEAGERSGRLLQWLLIAAWLAVAGTAIAWGSDYYSTPLAERPLHHLHDQLKPAGTVGLGYGFVGTFLIVFGVSMYVVRKRVPLLRNVGKLNTWLGVHIFMCTLGPFLILLHTSFRFGGIVSIAFWSMAAVTLSGIFGRYVYGHIPRTMHDHTMTRATVQTGKADLIEHITRDFPADAASLKRLLLVGKGKTPRGLVHAFWLTMRYDITKRWRSRQLSQRLARTRVPVTLQRDLVAAVQQQITLEQRMTLLTPLQRMFRYWHLFHLPLTVVMALVLAVHITVAVLFGYTWIF